MEEFKQEKNFKMLLEIASESRLIPALNDGTIHIHYFVKKFKDFIEKESSGTKSEKPAILLNKEFLQTLVPFNKSVPFDKSLPSNKSVPYDRSVPSNQSVPSDKSVPFDKSLPSNRSVPFDKPNEKPLVTYEEIQNERKTAWEREINKKQQEFSQSYQRVVPPTPTFQEDRDIPIGEMEKLIADTIAKRNYDIEAFQAMNPPPLPVSKTPAPATSIKYIQIGEEVPLKLDIVDVEEKPMASLDFFSRLKKDPLDPLDPSDPLVQLKADIQEIKDQIAIIMNLLKNTETNHLIITKEE